MKEITLRIPEEKLDFIMELIKQLDLEVAGSDETPEEHKEIVRQRIQNSDSSKLLAWAEVRKDLKYNDF
ncbi:hypothetical protein [Algoriphagus yeomjeoni]|uniref:Uncharacterized protein n=1 Tax=Algoriphagus yeomjeoni TaxID=291403 RepID=A0A327PSG4_9BACT|nr:hypothetical protein [Algoriphagus yeomjeoni]RAI95108.1 hypothetical protein LV83_00359 [Algoriphagus yeomjeoni]